MDAVDRFGYELAFSSIIYAINHNEVSFSETSKIYMGKVKEFFMNVTKGLESIISKKYVIVQDLRKIIEAAGYKTSDASKKDIGEMAKKFRDVTGQLDKLRENPKEFYNSEDSQQLLTLCNKVKDLYTDDPQVVTDEVLFDS